MSEKFSGLIRLSGTFSKGEGKWMKSVLLYKCVLLVSRICNDATEVQKSIYSWLPINSNFAQTIAVPHSAVHARTVEQHGMIATCINTDHAALAFNVNEFHIYNGVHRIE
jgi:hypothetical protein